MGCAIMALAAAAQQPDPVIASINDAYQKAKEATKKNKSMGNEMVTTLNYTVRDQGKTTEELHFYYNTIQGTYAFVEDRDPPEENQLQAQVFVREEGAGDGERKLHEGFRDAVEPF